MLEGKDLSRVEAGFKRVPPQFYFEIAGLASAEVPRNSKYGWGGIL